MNYPWYVAKHHIKNGNLATRIVILQPERYSYKQRKHINLSQVCCKVSILKVVFLQPDQIYKLLLVCCKDSILNMVFMQLEEGNELPQICCKDTIFKMVFLQPFVASLLVASILVARQAYQLQEYLRSPNSKGTFLSSTF